MLICGLGPVGCHLLYPFTAEPSLPDSAADGSVDAENLDAPGPDHPVLPPPGPFACGLAKQAGTNQSGYTLAEPALRAHGLELVARTGHTYASTRRAGPGQPFGPWTQMSSAFSGSSDPTFYLRHGSEQYIVTVPPEMEPRHLERCTQRSPCSRFTVRYQQSGRAVTADMDGASVAVLPGGGLLMAHNIGPLGVHSADIYLAVPVDATDLSRGWETSVVPALAQPDWKEDDPTLSPDGLVLLFNAPLNVGNEDLWISQRSNLDQPFPAPTPLKNLNTPLSDRAPSLSPLPPEGGRRRAELFFSRGASIYRALCVH